MALSRILVTGPDARPFLQGQLTCDLTLLSQSNPIWGAHCNLKGRVEALYQLFETPEGVILLLTPENVAEQALMHLRHYARFSKVSIEVLAADGVEEKHRREADLKNHIATLHPSTVGRFLPQEMGLIERGVVNFNKGCYLGQEVVARLHYLGKLKKTLRYVESDIPLTPGDTIAFEGGEAVVVDAEGCEALILIF